MHDFNINDFQWFEYYPGIATHVPDVTINADGIIFNSAVLKKLGLPPSIKLLFDSAGRRIAIQGLTKKGNGTIDLNPERKVNSFAISKSDRVQFIRGLMPEWDEHTRYKVEGDYHENENVMVFDLKTAVVFKGGSFPGAKSKAQ